MAISSHDIVPDSPTNVFASLNPLKNSGATLTNGNLNAAKSTSGWVSTVGTIAISNGKWYWEILPVTGNEALNGIVTTEATLSQYVGVDQDGWCYYSSGLKINNSSQVSYGTPYTNSNIIGVILDLNVGEISFYKDGVLQGTAYSNLSGEFTPAVSVNNGSVVCNFGQDPTFGGTKNTPATVTIDGQSVTGPFAPSGTAAGTAGLFYYPPPADALALCTANLPDPDIDPNTDDLPEDYFKAVKYVGDYSSPATISVGFNPDLVWIKQRTPYASQSHCLYDSVRGVSKRLYSDSTSQEITPDGNGGVTNFSDNNGFQLTRPTNQAFEGYNSSMQMIAWCWKAGGNESTYNWGDGTGSSTYSGIQSALSLPASSTSGMITPSGMSVNQKAGFSIVKYSGNSSSNSKLPHGLDNAPDFFVVKGIKNGPSGNVNWRVYHSDLGGTKNLMLNSSSQQLSVTSIWNDANPTSSVITLGNHASTNETGYDYIAYCWHSVAGYSAFGSYTGNGSADGPFVYTGFKPAWVMVKDINNVNSWWIYDSVRDPYNLTYHTLHAEDATQEESNTSYGIDLLSNGFKLKNGDVRMNGNTREYLFACFAETPFKYATAR